VLTVKGSKLWLLAYTEPESPYDAIEIQRKASKNFPVTFILKKCKVLGIYVLSRKKITFLV